MKIEGKGSATTPAERLQAIQSRESAADQQRKAAAEAASRTDRVEISAAGRAKAEGVEPGAESVSPRPVPADDPNRIELVRERVRSGFYASDEVQSAVARQIVARGDHLS
jgi:hypothetical protein